MPDTVSGQHLSPKQWPSSIPFVNAAITSSDLYQVEDVLTPKETLLQKSLLHKIQLLCTAGPGQTISGECHIQRKMAFPALKNLLDSRWYAIDYA